MDTAISDLLSLVTQRDEVISSNVGSFFVFMMGCTLIAIISMLPLFSFIDSNNPTRHKVLASVCYVTLLLAWFVGAYYQDPERKRTEVNATYSPKIETACEAIFAGIQEGTVQWYHPDAVKVTTEHCDKERLYSLLPKPVDSQ